MKNIRSLYPATCLVLLLAFLACTGYPGICNAQTKISDKYGLVAGLGGLGDKAFNDMLHAGLFLAQTRDGIDLVVDSVLSDEENTQVIEDLIQKENCTVIVSGGYQMASYFLFAAKKHPDVHFILMDRALVSYPPNLTSVTFRQNEGSFLVGALAAGTTKTGKIGFLGATELPVIQDFFEGFKAGAARVSPEVQVEEHYIGELSGNFNPFMSPVQSHRMSLGIYNSGVDILFAATGGSNAGAITAAQESKKFIIGADADQDHMSPGYVLTSMMKRLDLAILLMVEKRLAGELEARNYSLGLAEGGVSLSPMTFTRAIIPDDVLEKIEQYKAGIISGDIQVPTALK